MRAQFSTHACFDVMCKYVFPPCKLPAVPYPAKKFYRKSRAVSETNLLIHLNRILDAYDAELKNEALIAENTTLKNTKIIHRLDRKDRHQDVQDACQIHDLSLRESFLQSCEQLGIPPLAMTYFLDRITSGDSELIMRNLGIGPTGAVAVAEALARNASVKRLDISLNDIQDKGAIAVAKLLEVNSNIVNVSLSENKIGKDGAEALGNMLTVNDSLLRIDISRNQLTDEDIQFFSSVLQTEDSLSSLDVSHNSLGITGGEYLGEMVALNSSLRELNLGWNRLGDQGVKTFCVGLNENRTLEKLDLCWNEIGHEGAKCIASSIEHNGKLMVLNLNNNRITDRGMEKIAKSLEFNDTLKVLKIGFNLITSGGACALLRSLLKNSGSAIEEVRMAEVEINSSIKELYYRLKIRKPRFQLLELSTASGDLYHFVKPQNPMMVLDDYLKRNQLNARRHGVLEGDEDCY
ncbi:leucine-rich repeat-containing protein 74B-like isoform X1 [Montipora capricornis]|uniref:leucine-rich repeat-containing protein 74B-like isoform X1 n=1 Tax=Montipora capricornis TaxID=246305 RepID=UPI0035F1925A